MTRAFPALSIFWMLSLLTAEIIEALSPTKNGLTLLITVGNSMRSDDGVGPYIFSNIDYRISNIEILNAEDRPENIIDEAIGLKPEKVVIIDSASFSGKPGEVRIIPEEHINDTTLSTHMFPLGAIAKLIKDDTGAQVLFLGIQQANIGFGEKISSEVLKTAEEIIECVTRSQEKLLK